MNVFKKIEIVFKFLTRTFLLYAYNYEALLQLIK